MKNLEQVMREVASALTGETVENIPPAPLEKICEFIAENYKASAKPAFIQVTSPANAAGETPTQAEFNAVIQKLKDAKVFK